MSYDDWKLAAPDKTLDSRAEQRIADHERRIRERNREQIAFLAGHWNDWRMADYLRLAARALAEVVPLPDHLWDAYVAIDKAAADLERVEAEKETNDA